MNELIAVEKIAQWEKLKTLVLDSVSSPITKRVYDMALNEFMEWFQQAPRPGFTKATVSAWRVSLEERRPGSSSIIIRMSAIRKLAAEAADNGLLAPELAAGISRVKSVIEFAHGTALASIWLHRGCRCRLLGGRDQRSWRARGRGLGIDECRRQFQSRHRSFRNASHRKQRWLGRRNLCQCADRFARCSRVVSHRSVATAYRTGTACTCSNWLLEHLHSIKYGRIVQKVLLENRVHGCRGMVHIHYSC